MGTSDVLSHFCFDLLLGIPDAISRYPCKNKKFCAANRIDFEKGANGNLWAILTRIAETMTQRRPCAMPWEDGRTAALPR